ncbi:PIN domain-containing protein [Mucilaginibacter gotjawali]|uniref:PIN domain protein n=2 Tax=Mucilaginibacter gotjawali TaxID=1550579 RepID=A0A110B1A4_9SPHI|nr:PIN domain-containing protein [Mucilaginibacter gotjawali]MBB3057328.1 hypothetical protein [Mucilaginibacter gotjawali]BAU52906.1 PIN domain protein [Mucilaginibacter gotjawali]
MNGIKYLADTNCFIYLLDQNPIISPFLSHDWAFSYITEIELLSKKGLTRREDSMIREMLDTCYKINHSQKLSDLAITLKRNNNIKLPDAIIAASSQLLKLPLITADKGFVNIKELDCIILSF